jgi:hypothetical protein
MGYSRKMARGLGVLIGASLAAISFGLSVPPASAQTSSVASSAGSWTVETQKAHRTGSKPYFIEFRARAAASYGHMYVLYGRVNGRDEIVKSRIAGLHPAGDAENCFNCSLFNWTIGHLVPVPSETGASDGDLEEKYVTARYRVWLTGAEYKKVDAYIRKLQADSPLWNALWNNCVGFGRKIAEFMGLKVPLFFWLEPKDFVTDLREMNGMKTEQLPLRDAAADLSRMASRTPLPPQKPKLTRASGQPSASTIIKPEPAKPKKPVTGSTAVRAVASSGNVH